MSPDGPIEFDVVIRTIVVDKNKNARLNVGGGAACDRTADSKYAEALLEPQTPIWKVRLRYD